MNIRDWDAVVSNRLSTLAYILIAFRSPDQNTMDVYIQASQAQPPQTGRPANRSKGDESPESMENRSSIHKCIECLSIL